MFKQTKFNNAKDYNINRLNHAIVYSKGGKKRNCRFLLVPPGC